MDDDLEVPVTYKDQELIFNAKFIQFGYSYKFEVDVNGIIFLNRTKKGISEQLLIRQLITGVINLIKN